MMNPIAFQIGPVAVYWYGILIALTFLSAYLVSHYNGKLYNIEPEIIDTLFFQLSIIGLVGARLAVVLVNLPYYLANPIEIVAREGLGSHGAIIAIMVLGYFIARRLQVKYWTIADIAAPILPIAHIFVRLGNFINGELYGPPTSAPWGVQFRTTLVAVHPTQLYEALLSLAILPLAWLWSRNSKYPGYAFLRVLLLHSVVRFFVDFIRQHSDLIGPFVLTQIIALILAIMLGAMIWHKEKTRN